ncbi:VOC family protein [Pseudooceanicola sp. HF7]|uniref:VOC family protein n=1 Tax=Pseudooceanicola sp. HF7 TaxID=2721560 RepID=UPI0014305230|nr:VOC family protein [Pseudooceanicola sp. HF7]NIZ09672.1 VOC family protein [Pseudooceanicola sp. HF7]
MSQHAGSQGAFDHLVVAAPTLSAGLDHAQAALGVTIPQGGVHPLMGTHNHLVRLGDASFLEVIAPDPDAPAPGRPRWFGLDQPPATPRLLHWVIRLPGLAARRAELPDQLGPAIEQVRGDLRWLITVPEDGSLPFGGAFLTVIDWSKPEQALPPRAMPGAGLALEALEVRHPQADRIAALLAPVLQDPRIRFTPAPEIALEAQIMGPDGLRRLR